MRKRSKTKQVTRTKLHFIAILLLLSQLAIGQVYPVNVTGSLMMPASNNISDLGSGDASKLTYTINLNDPVENALEVYLQVVVKNNNRVIMQSNPDLKTVRRTLMRGQPLSISGSDIATLLNFNNLQGRNGFGRSNKLPKGLNAICVVAYSTLRGVPVSNEGCASGLYQDLKVPVIELPNCGSSMQLSDNQNVQFKWAPRHIGSPNAPSMVNYEIEIKEMPAGSISPADVFANATLFLKRTVTTSSFLLNDTDPKLVAGKTYAWRVRAKSATTGSYFLNDGYSEYCSFSVMSKGHLSYTILCIGNLLNPCNYWRGKSECCDTSRTDC